MNFECLPFWWTTLEEGAQMFLEGESYVLYDVFCTVDVPQQVTFRAVRSVSKMVKSGGR